MPKLSLNVRIAATSILLLSLTHIIFWGGLATYVAVTGLNNGQFATLFIAFCLISAAGVVGVTIALGIFGARNWARIAAIGLGAVSAFVCAIALLVLFVLIVASPQSFGLFDNMVAENRGNFIWAAFIYLLVLALSLWWIFLFAKKTVAAQLSSTATAPLVPNKH